MFDLRPVGYVSGFLVAALGAAMLLPMLVDVAEDNGHAGVFLQSAIITFLTGTLLALACANGAGGRMSIQQTFMLTTGVWFILPLFGALPFIDGATEASFTDAVFEAMSGLTTTGSTVFSNLDGLPKGLLLWRSMMQWFGGIGIIVVAMAFLPELRVGGMQIFRSEAFDATKVLPRAAEIAARIAVIYIGLTGMCFLAYSATGMSTFDAVNHAMTTLATGGFSTRDASFGAFKGAAEYVATVFMLLASLPFVRYVQLVAGSHRPIFVDSQIRVFLAIFAATVAVVAGFLLLIDQMSFEFAMRETVFNVASIITGTGYASTDYQTWGDFPVVVFFLIGLIGGCAGSTCCSVKVFRYQILASAIVTQMRRIHSPHGIFEPRYDGRRVGEDVLSSVMAFFVLFFVTLSLLAIALGATGLDFVTAVSGAATAVANVGPGLGPVIGPAGNFETLSDTAKWLLTAGMLVGRLELMAVFVLFTSRFWAA